MTEAAPLLPDGVFLNLSHAIHRADSALGSTDHKDILANIVQWKGRRDKDLRRFIKGGEDDDSTPGKAFGEALHVKWLEPERFDEKFCVEPDLGDLPDTKDEIAEAMREAGITPPRAGAKRAEFVAEARFAGIKTADDLDADRAAIVAGRTVISQEWYDFLELAKRVFDLHPEASKALSNGLSEVTVIWTDENGLRLKARFDYLRVRLLPDLKSFAYRPGREPIATFVMSAEQFGYDLQGAHYMDGRLNALPRLVAEGKVYDWFGAGVSGAGIEIITGATAETGLEYLRDSVVREDMEFLQRVAAEENPEWAWLTLMTGGVPEVDLIRFPRETVAFAAAQNQVEIARARYLEYRSEFGEDGLWLARRGRVRLTDFDFSRRQSSRGLATWENDV